MYRKSRLKTLGALPLALIAVLAVTASAAQAATWTVKQNGESLLHLEVSGIFSLGEIRTNSGTIHCNAGLFGTALVQLNASHEVSTMLVHGIFTSCSYLGLASCTVSSPGGKAGEVPFKAAGPMESKLGATYGTVEGKEMAVFAYSGEECPLAEVTEALGGSMRLTIGKAEEEVATHTVELNENKLLLGGKEAFIDAKEKAGAITGELKGKEGAKFSISFK